MIISGEFGKETSEQHIEDSQLETDLMCLIDAGDMDRIRTLLLKDAYKKEELRQSRLLDFIFDAGASGNNQIATSEF